MSPFLEQLESSVPLVPMDKQAFPEKRGLAYCETDIPSEVIPAYELVFNELFAALEFAEHIQDLESLDGLEIKQEKATYGLAGVADLARLIVQSREANRGEIPSWGDYQFRYYEDVVAQNTDIPHNGLFGEIGTGPTAMGIKNMIKAFSQEGEIEGESVFQAGIIAVEKDAGYAQSAFDVLTEEGYDVELINAKENEEKIKDLAEKARGSGKTFIVIAEASDVLSEMEGEFDFLAADKVMQHLDDEPRWWPILEQGKDYPTPGVFGKNVGEALTENGKFVVLDLLLDHKTEGWLIEPDPGYEDHQGVAIHDQYMKQYARPAWERRGARLFGSLKDVRDFTKETTGLKAISKTGREYYSGVCQDPNRAENFIAATMPAAIVGGALGALEKYLEAFAALPEEAVQAKDQLRQVIQQRLCSGIKAAAGAGIEYLNQVVLNPKITIKMPRYGGEMYGREQMVAA